MSTITNEPTINGGVVVNVNVPKKKHRIRNTLLAIVGGIVAIAIISSAVNGGSKSTSTSSSPAATTANGQHVYRFADRADKQEKDVEVVPGEAATLDGVHMTVTSATYAPDTTSIARDPALAQHAGTGKQYLIANVHLQNSSSGAKAYNSFDFRVQTAGGQVLDSTFTTSDKQLQSGDLVTNGTADGYVVFEVPAGTGHEYVIWKPSAWSSARAIVQAR